ncbi:hypothetical protein AVEN_44430-1 [Araneus ventricosus]|uniref:Uncharacterized protein n=1 Tax=Araneus ventricosus TaxID=182803 RepID=A0A4Y2S1H8_ARAVE|nr:hypothetical protein AVEN_254701-1 [Araneus ventricosus]GBN81074.1 hypothetical protein AVEN_144814-1 [Araneus ventricosus]GBN81122.1 hypothetical protein AVEN_207913-1 [Araneus ventricosus]GBN81169.1 hypothetical protein AVEN_44430-1 [Araneus ventricosus]
MTRTKPELAPSLQTSAPHQREDDDPLHIIQRETGPHKRRIFAGTRFQTWNPPARSRDLTTRPPRALGIVKNTFNISKCWIFNAEYGYVYARFIFERTCILY